MIKTILRHSLALLFAAFLVTPNNYSEKKASFCEPLEQTGYKTNLRMHSQNNNDAYDIETYDIYGNHQYYKYDDFIYDETPTLNAYHPSNTINTRSEYDKYYSLPYSAICTFYSTYDTNNDGVADVTFVGSGALVGPNEVLTAEENTYNTDYGYAIDMYVALGEHRENGSLVRPFGIQHWTMIMRGNYHTTFDANDNWALVRLDSNIGYTSGWLGVSYIGISNGSTVKAVGYNSYSSCEATIYQGTVSSLQTYKFNYNAYPPMMANGCPVMDAFLGTVVGIHCSKRTTVNNITYCQACKISIYIKGWIQEDCGPLKVTIFSDPDAGSSSGSGVGHSWIVVKNNSPEYVQIGKMNLAPNTAVTLGTWGNTVHSGLYYNLEYNRASVFPHRVSFSRNIFANDWNNSYVLTNDYWLPFENCAFFATNLWNSMFPLHQVNYGTWPTPASVANSISQFSGYNYCEYVNGTNTVGYYSGNTFVPSLS